MKKGIKLILWITLIILALIQFVPINRENPEVDITADFLELTNAPENVHNIINNSCYDCHSNKTNWPWYSRIAPFSIAIAQHVKEGREHLNFSEWANYAASDQQMYLKEIKKEIEKKAMPPAAYLKFHSEAEISIENKLLIFKWLDSLSNI